MWIDRFTDVQRGPLIFLRSIGVSGAMSFIGTGDTPAQEGVGTGAGRADSFYRT